MNHYLVITNSNNNFFSGIKTNSPKILNSMKELCVVYGKMFSEEYKVRRVIPTKSGLKFI